MLGVSIPKKKQPYDQSLFRMEKSDQSVCVEKGGRDDSFQKEAAV